MHLVMMAIAIVLAWGVRLNGSRRSHLDRQTWQRALFLFLFPQLILSITAVSILLMGPSGGMLGLDAGWYSYSIAVIFILWSILLLLKLGYEGYLSRQQVYTYPQRPILGKMARILPCEFPYIARIGFWNSELVISQGAIAILSPDCLEAVLAHEQAHHYYRDTFWFFWLGWLAAITSWLPDTESLWQELLLLREIRADRQAARQVDPLLLAEALLLVTQKAARQESPEFSNNFCAALSPGIPGNRLAERIDALLSESDRQVSSFNSWCLVWVLLAFLPLITIPFHY